MGSEVVSRYVGSAGGADRLLDRRLGKGLSPMGQDGRSFFRVPIEVGAVMTRASDPDEPVPALMVNFSASGCALECPVYGIEAGEEIALEFDQQRPLGQKPVRIRVVGEILRIDQRRLKAADRKKFESMPETQRYLIRGQVVDSELMFTLRVRFKNLNRVLEDQLVAMVNEIQLENLRLQREKEREWAEPARAEKVEGKQRGQKR